MLIIYSIISLFIGLNFGIDFVVEYADCKGYEKLVAFVVITITFTVIWPLILIRKIFKTIFP